jgi:glycosyltransferase involved in cell wall biosynthesis
MAGRGAARAPGGELIAPMRVVMLVRNSCVRDARVLRVAAALASPGREVSVVAMLEPGLPKVEERDGFRIVRVPSEPRWVRTIAGRPLISPQSPGASAGKGPPKRRSGIAYAVRDALVSAQISRAALARPADVYHAHDLNTLAAGARAARRHGAQLVYDSHDLYPELSGLTARERRRWRAHERRWIGRADAIVTVSSSIAHELQRRYGVPLPTVVLNVPAASPGSGSGPASGSRSWPGPIAATRREGKMLVLYSGGFSANRGLEALADAAERASSWTLTMMGWGPLAAEIRRRAPTVRIVDPVDPDRVIEASAAADVGVIPYLPVGLNNALSLPNKLFEYLHAGLAIAASDLVELRRFVADTGAGVLFRPGDVASIAEALDGIASDPATLERLRSSSRRATARYDWESQKRALREVYERIGVAPRVTRGRSSR